MDENQESQMDGWEAEEEDVEWSRSRVLGPSTMGNGRLCIKLKIPKAESVADHHEQQQQQQQQQDAAIAIAIAKDHFVPRICNICDKAFASGKALGGHMRMHVQARNKLDLQLQKNQKQLQLAAAAAADAPPKPMNTSVSILGEPTCCVCGKNFPTMKALFGHMRSHPGRPWRGILPPPTEKNNELSSSSSTVVSDGKKIDSASEAAVAVDLLPSSQLGWKVTGKRGRKSIASSTTSGSGSGSGSGTLSPGIEEEEEGMQEVVCEVLLRLANSNPKKRFFDDSEAIHDDTRNYSPSKKKKKQPRNIDIVEAEAEADDAGSSREDLSKKMNDDKGKGKAVLETHADHHHHPLYMKWKLWEDDQDCYYSNEMSTNADDEDHDLDRHNSNNSSELVSDNEILGKMMMRKKKMMMRKKRKIKFVDLEALKDGAVNPPNRYICCLCNKSFPTHQALGGHKSSHNKSKNNNNIQLQTVVVNESVSAADDDDDDSAAEDCTGGHYYADYPTTQLVDELAESSVVAAAVTHQCKICDKTFPTGQALGGHKRCHWTGQSPAGDHQAAKAQSSQATSPGEFAAKDHSSCQVTSPGEASCQTGRRILDFDLNELPAMEVEEATAESVIYMQQLS